jgi:hypothetical protein
VSEIKKVEGSKLKRMNLNVEVPLHSAFKSATAAQGQSMTDVLLKYIEDYVAQHSPSTKKPKRRRA